ncbi:MAG: methionine--tRNA ligase [Phycisphaerales bacterium]
MSRYISTPIYYVNDRPHIGHAYTTTVCDVYARFMRFMGEEVFFLTGTDEHGIKVEKSAAEKGISPQVLADRNAAEFERILGMFGLSNDDFIRTTQLRHTEQVKQIVAQLLAQDDVYLAEYEGWYDEGQEEFVPQSRAEDQQFKSVVSGKPLVRMKEANYFFRLSGYQDRLSAWYESHPDFVRPEARRNEMLGRLREGLADIPVSRTSFSWGIPVPGDEAHVLWVWLDALSNYITALGVIDAEVAGVDRSHFWPATFHVIGKEILFFHALFWPAVLMALKLPLPECVYAHSFWISHGQKMSKSLGNFIDLEVIQGYLDVYSLDAWRYYMVTQGPLSAQDADFSADHFRDIYNAHLVNTLGNCASRTTAMIGKYFDGALPGECGAAGERIVIEGWDWPVKVKEYVQAALASFESLDLAAGVGQALQMIRDVDVFINATEPFKIAKDASKRTELGAILYQCAEVVRIASCLLWAVMPSKVEELWKALGQDVDTRAGGLQELVAWGGLVRGDRIEKVALFPRVEG